MECFWEGENLWEASKIQAGKMYKKGCPRGWCKQKKCQYLMDHVIKNFLIHNFHKNMTTVELPHIFSSTNQEALQLMLRHTEYLLYPSSKSWQPVLLQLVALVVHTLLLKKLSILPKSCVQHVFFNKGINFAIFLPKKKKKAKFYSIG